MFEPAGGRARNALGDWMLRGGIALVFTLAGADKSSNGWVRMFREIALGQWFRYFTGVVEIAGGVLVLIPGTESAGLALLACTMASATLIPAFIMGNPGDSVFPFGLLTALIVFWWNRRSQE